MRFRQSLMDFPVTISLGDKMPSWGLKRWDGVNGLCFTPMEDEGYSLRGDRRQVLYKGKRRSHRFTILSNSAFEYDVVLLREPESNVICLRMDGAERFDFFRQPEFVSDPFIKGSYAVYKKETLVGEGTGKLCHIHRPEIIDARGRRCWGELSVDGNCLRITIPEMWISEAKYPVIVDPTVGTTTVGSVSGWDINTNTSSINSLLLNQRIAVNKFTVPERITGVCTGYMMSNGGSTSDIAGRFIIYSNSGSNMPTEKLTSNEQMVDLHLNYGKPDSWRSAEFSVGTISTGANIWFGLTSEYKCYPKFDFGAVCYAEPWTTSARPTRYPDIIRAYDFKISWYFTYIANYNRLLQQGVSLSDINKNNLDYKRNLSQTVSAASILEMFKMFGRIITETIAMTHSTKRWAEYHRESQSIADNIDGMEREVEYNRRNADTIRPVSSLFCGLLVSIKIITQVLVRDYLLSRFLKAKSEMVLKSRVTREITLESKIN